MPVLWRYLIFYFLKIVTASVLSFIALLLTLRFDEIAHFAALGAPPTYLLFFTLSQIPYILPIAIPLSCLIASLILFQRLSHTHELTALRASGFSLFDILAPLLFTASFLSIINFWVTSELATQSHLQNNLLKSELRSINPLLLLHNKHLMRLKGFYFEALGPSHVGESADDVILTIPNKHQQRLNLMVAGHLKAAPSIFVGQKVTLISTIANENDEDFDNLLIENMATSETHLHDFSNLLQKKVWTINNDYLKLPLLLSRIEEQRQLLKEAQLKKEDQVKIKNLKREIQRSFSEIVKRFSIAAAVFTFTFMGTTFGLNISRKHHSYTLYFAIILTTFYLISFFVAKGMDHRFWLSSTLYLAPHFCLLLTSFIFLKRISKGME